MEGRDCGVAIRRFFDFVIRFHQIADQPPSDGVLIVSDEKSTHARDFTVCDRIALSRIEQSGHG